MTDFTALRRNMVDAQLRTYDVNSKRVLDAVDSIPREAFVPPAASTLAYADQSFVIAAEHGETRALIQPMVLARMIQSAEIEAGEKVLNLAGGSGYGAAIMAAMGASVTMLESSEGLAGVARRSLLNAGIDSVSVVVGDLEAGYPASAAYDVILIEGALEALPETLAAQLADGGRMVAVLGLGRAGRVAVWQRSAQSIGKRTVFDAAAAPLAAFRQPAGFAF
jgi:protein-L-isoaspartate(D-aspartate) O-methyltransferase